MLCEIQLHSEVSAVAPAEIELEMAAMIIDEGQPQPSVVTHGPIPAAIWVRDVIGVASDAEENLVLDSDHIKGEVVPGIPERPS